MEPLATKAGCRSEYQEFPVPVPLQTHLLCFWTQSIVGEAGVYSHRVLPDACVDIVFINDEAPVLVGPWCESFIADFPHGTKILGARFKPGSAPDLLRVPGCELRNRSLPLSEVSGVSAFARLSPVFDQSSLSLRKAALETALCGWLLSSTLLDGTPSYAMHWLARHPGGRVAELCRGIGISTRQLHRRFEHAVGYGPKLFQSVVRFQRLLNLGARPSAGLGLADLAAEAGYADQSHMTREVRRFSGVSPTALLRFAECTLRLSELCFNYDCLS